VDGRAARIVAASAVVISNGRGCPAGGCGVWGNAAWGAGICWTGAGKACAGGCWIGTGGRAGAGNGGRKTSQAAPAATATTATDSTSASPRRRGLDRLRGRAGATTFGAVSFFGGTVMTGRMPSFSIAAQHARPIRATGYPNRIARARSSEVIAKPAPKQQRNHRYKKPSEIQLSRRQPYRLRHLIACQHLRIHR
jgi:hypothetical protein